MAESMPLKHSVSFENSKSLSFPRNPTSHMLQNPKIDMAKSKFSGHSMPGSKNVLKKIDYDKLKIQEVNHLPPRFDGTQLFVLPAAEASSSQTRAKSLQGRDKQYDGHVWTKTQTTNITNDVGLAFRSSTCVGHLQCENPSCDYLQH